MNRVMVLYAWIFIDEKTGEEVACAFGSTEKPIGVHADHRKEVLETLRPKIEEMAEVQGKRAELRKFGWID